MLSDPNLAAAPFFIASSASASSSSGATTAGSLLFTASLILWTANSIIPLTRDPKRCGRFAKMGQPKEQRIKGDHETGQPDHGVLFAGDTQKRSASRREGN